jgi:hypothetical protein
MALAVVLLSGCAETQLPNATGKGTVRGLNAVAGLADVTFLIEERGIATLSYKNASSATRYDDLNYTFNFDLPIPGATQPRRLASRNVDVIADNDYLFVLAGDASSQQTILWERPLRDWAGTETTFELDFGHVNGDAGAIDVYLTTPGTPPALGSAIGSLQFGERLEAVEFETGSYEFVVTPQNDPATILYQSPSIEFQPAQSSTLAIFDADPGITAPVSVRLITDGGSAVELPDVRYAPTVQFVHAAFGTGNVDIAIDGDFTDLAVTDLAYGTISPDVEVPAGEAAYLYAPTGNTTALLDEPAIVANGSRSMFILVGEPGELATIRLPSDRRGYSTVAQLRIVNAVTDSAAIDIYVVEPGTDISERFPSIFGVALGFTSVSQQIAGDYEIIVTPNGDKTPLVGPVPLTLAVGDITEIVVLDTADPAISDLLIFSNIDP